MSPVTPGGEVLTRELVYYSNEVNCQAYAEKEADKQRKRHAQTLAKTGGKIVGVCSEKKSPSLPNPLHLPSSQARLSNP